MCIVSRPLLRYWTNCNKLLVLFNRVKKSQIVTYTCPFQYHSIDTLMCDRRRQDITG